MPATQTFGQFAPDLTDLGTGVSNNLTNVVPRGDGYGPFPMPSQWSAALPGPCRGYFFARKSDDSIAVFAGTATDLYLLSNTNFQWTKVSNGGVSYSGLVSSDNWVFDQFGDLVIACQINTPPQKYSLSGGGNFANLGGSPPASAWVTVIGLFVVLGGLLSEPRRVQWSDLDAPESWTAGVGLADFQDWPDGGNVLGISGGDAYGLIYQDDLIRSMVYAPGSSTVFQFYKISENDTLFAKYSVVSVGLKTFFISAQGFKVSLAGQAPTPIGKERVDRFFNGDVDRNNLQLVVAAADPQATRVYFAYKSKAGQLGQFDKILVYDWSIGDGGSWSLLVVSGQYLTALARPGLTLENMDAIAQGAISITNAANNGSGLIRLTLSPGTTNGPFTIIGQNFIEVQGVGGTTEANGSWVPIIIDSTHIDLKGSAFVNAYTSGGAIGGSIETLGFSFDSIAKSAVTALSLVNTNNTVGFFDGANLDAVVETPEADSQGQMVFVEKMLILTDCASALGSIGSRNGAAATVTYGAETAIDGSNISPQLIECRYARAKVHLPGGSVWTYVRGVQPFTSPAGEY